MHRPLFPTERAVNVYRDKWVPHLTMTDAAADLDRVLATARDTGIAARGPRTTVWLCDGSVRVLVHRDAESNEHIVVTVLAPLPESAVSAAAAAAPETDPADPTTGLPLFAFPAPPEGREVWQIRAYGEELKAMLHRHHAIMQAAPRGSPLHREALRRIGRIQEERCFWKGEMRDAASRPAPVSDAPPTPRSELLAICASTRVFLARLVADGVEMGRDGRQLVHDLEKIRELAAKDHHERDEPGATPPRGRLLHHARLDHPRPPRLPGFTTGDPAEADPRRRVG